MKSILAVLAVLILTVSAFADGKMSVFCGKGEAIQVNMNDKIHEGVSGGRVAVTTITVITANLKEGITYESDPIFSSKEPEDSGWRAKILGTERVQNLKDGKLRISMGKGILTLEVLDPKGKTVNSWFYPKKVGFVEIWHNTKTK